MMTPSLVQLLADALDLEFADRPRIATLATVDERGAARARSVIVRRLTRHGEFWITSDARSEKNRHLRARPAAELVFYLAGRREQLRVAGDCTPTGEGDARRQEAWNLLSDESRALFFGPAPGTRRVSCDDHFSQRVPATTPIPASFELIVLTPREVDHLRLSPWPHGRVRYSADRGWQGEELNP